MKRIVRSVLTCLLLLKRKKKLLIKTQHVDFKGKLPTLNVIKKMTNDKNLGFAQ